MFQDKLRELMGEKGMKAVDLARATGLSEAAISDYLKGKKEPRGRQSIAIAKALGVSLDILWETGFQSGEIFSDNANTRAAQDLIDRAIGEKKESPSPSEESEGEELPPNIMGQPWAYASRVQEAMQKRGMSVEQLAQLTGYPEDTVRKFVSKEIDQPNVTAPRYARALRVNAAWIQGFNAPMERNNYGGLPDDLVDLIDAYRMVPEHNKATALRIIQSFLAEP